MTIDLICLDADDTLWHNMRHFNATEEALLAMLRPFADAHVTRDMLNACEARNLALYGYGAKAFTLSMIRRIFAQHNVAPEHAVMAGDSMRSDVKPALEAGAWAAYIPQDGAWSHEVAAPPPSDHPRFRRLDRLADLPEWIDAIGG